MVLDSMGQKPSLMDRHAQMTNGANLVVEIPVVDDGRVQPLCMLLDDVKVGLGDHGRGSFETNHVVQVGHHLTEHLLRFLVQVGNNNASSQECVI